MRRHSANATGSARTDSGTGGTTLGSFATVGGFRPAGVVPLISSVRSSFSPGGTFGFGIGQ
jgi:hypothetical protein